MGGEYGCGLRHQPGLLEFEMSIQLKLMRSFKEGKCSMALVNVQGMWLDAQCPQGTHAANSQEHFLFDAVDHVATVQAVGDRPVSCGVVL